MSQKMSVKEWVYRYHSLGLNVLPASRGKKNPNIPSWKQYQNKQIAIGDVDSWIKSGRYQNINLCLGSVSGVWEIDVDVKNAPVGLITLGHQKDVWVCESSEGKVKIFFKTSVTLPSKLDIVVNKDGEHVELRGNNHLSVLPPSKHPSGCYYKWLGGDFTKPLNAIDGSKLYNDIVHRLQAEFQYQEERKEKEIEMNNSGDGVRDFFFKSMKNGTSWSGMQGHYFRLAFCAELINNGYDDEQIHTFFKTHDANSGESYSRDITQKKITELRKKGMRCWTNKKLKECCSDILEEL